MRDQTRTHYPLPPAAADSFQTLVDLLRWRAIHQADRLAYTFLPEAEAEGRPLTYGELDRRARGIAAGLGSLGAAGERVLLLYPPGLEYIAAFFGCLYAGSVAVPVYPPRLNRSLSRLRGVAADSGAKLALSTASILSRLEPLTTAHPELSGLRWLAADEWAEGAESGWQSPPVGRDTLAFLQYTSGSTGAPKGVMLSHGNLLHNSAMLAHAFEYTSESRCVSWLPLYHDMGLIGGMLQPLYGGFPCTLMSPASFLQQPLRWLRAVSREQATISGGPNFAYELCVRKIGPEQRATLDLSSWSVAFNGSEPLRQDTLRRFAEAFGPCGFRPESFYPCYGLAEATLIVSGGRTRNTPPVVRTVSRRALEQGRVVELPASDPACTTLVGSGRVLPGQRVVIADPQTSAPCEGGRVGEVWISGPSVAAGYWNQPLDTEQTFEARLVGEGEEPFLRAGDLGFVSDGELFITGRLKDLIIIRGVNHYPQDIERSVEHSHAHLRPGCGAAFSIELNDEEQLVVVQEVDRRPQEPDGIIAAIRQAVAAEHQLQPAAVALIRRGSIPKTSSGKIQRRACRALFLNGGLNVEAEWREAASGTAEVPKSVHAAAGAVGAETPEDWLRTTLATLLRLAPAEIDPDEPIMRYGLDSLTAVGLSHGIEARFGVVLPLSSLLEGTSISELSSRVRDSRPPGGVSDPTADPAEAPAAGGVQPLSSSQQSLWFLHQLAPGEPTYNLAFAARIRSGLDVSSLRSAFQALVDRHAALRTTFETGDGGPVQRVHERVEVHFREEDASGVDEARLRERLAAEARLPFDLERGPLLKLHLFARPAGEYVLLLTAHHIILDFWSLAVLMHELGLLYGGGSELPPLAGRHSDYVRWQGELLRSEEGERHRSYWQRQLSGRLPVLELPTDRPRPPVQTYRGAAHSFRLGPGLTRSLKALSRDHEATLYTTLLAAFQLLLHRYTGQEEILVGSPTPGRSRGWLAGLVGYLVNPVVLRAELSAGQTFEEFLGQVRRTVLAAFEHQDYPFTLLVKSLQPERDASRSPLFQVMFALQKSHLRDGQGVAAFAVGDESARVFLDDVSLEAVPLPQRAAHFDLSLVLVEVGESLAASLEYNTDLFDAATVERMSRHFEVLLEAVAADPRARLGELPVLPEDERRQILFGWNETRHDFPEAGLCVQQLFERRAAATPHAPALLDGDRLLSYGELNARANLLARLLRLAGVGPESVVALCAGRSFGLAVGALAVLKSGGAYLPLDPSYPDERLRFMLEDSGARVLLTEASLSDRFSGTRAAVIDLNAEGESGGGEGDFDGGASPENLAYVIYTSGSTGRPKGVSVPHRALSNLVSWHQRRFRLTPSDHATLLASVSFDASVWELWPYLCSGASVDIPGDEIRSSPERLRDWIVGRRVTLSFVPTPLAEPMLGLEWEGDVPLRALLTGGDKLRGWPPEGLPFEVVNNYGPTENAVVTTSGEVKAGGVSGARAPGLGRPLSNVRVYILDGGGRAVPVGVAGEIYVGGKSLARGYLDRPALTAERFVPDWLSGEPGARLYRTGDVARYLPGGEIEFLGRNDGQVKVRGHRVELGEVEAALRQLPGVAQAVARTAAAGGEVRLVGYVVGEAGAEPDGSEVRRALATRLPEYMLPAQVLVLDRLPLTRNGKVDFDALPAPESGRARPEEGLVAPRNEVERLIARAWQEALGIDEVGVHDNFFELGGHSLLATQMVSRLHRDLRVEIRLSEFYKAQTVAGMAELVERLRPARPPAPRGIKVQPRGGKTLDSLLAQIEDLSEPGAERPARPKVTD